jgi:hypothetical protein
MVASKAADFESVTDRIKAVTYTRCPFQHPYRIKIANFYSSDILHHHCEILVYIIYVEKVSKSRLNHIRCHESQQLNIYLYTRFVCTSLDDYI